MVSVSLSKDKKKVIIEADVDALVPSASGKSLVIASTRGNLKTAVNFDHGGVSKPITVGLNVYIPAN